MKRDPNLTYFDPVKDAAEREAALEAALAAAVVKAQQAKVYPPLRSC